MTPPHDALPLARGGIIFPTAAGWIQYGAVPETIKDTMVLPSGVPSIYVVPRRMFCAERGVSLAELEFPCYFNFFIRGAVTTVVCRTEQRPLLEQLLSEAVFGPRELDPSEFSGRPGEPDLRSELDYFRQNPKRAGEPMQLSDLVCFVEFDSSGRAALPEGVSVALEEDGGVTIHERGVRRFTFGAEPPLPPRPPAEKGVLKAFWAPLLGVSVIGSGHGFDPGNRTSGFIVWIEGHGVMVDPPVDSVDWFRGHDISAKQVDTLILTHCHADHDAGTLQKILQEGRVTIYATPTVMSSFVTKYSALTGLSPAAFRALFDFMPVITGNPVYLHGAEATFRYSLHSIPCTGFEIRLRGRSLMYPSDTLNEPNSIARLHDQGVLTQPRRDALLNFPWQHTLVLHEAGIPPIHTPIDYLSKLSEEVKKRTLLVHVSEKSIPPGSGLKVAPTGLEHTIDLGASHIAAEEALEALDAMGRVEIFTELPVTRAAEFLRMITRDVYETGQTIVAAGQPGDKFYIVLHGQVAVWKNGVEFKIYRSYDYFGETALILDQPRVADVIAKTHVELLALGRAAFLHLLRGTDLPARLVHLAHMRELPSWELLTESPVFMDLTSNQKTQLQALMEPLELQPGTEVGADPMLVAEGNIEVRAGDRAVDVLQTGDFAGDVGRLQKDAQSPFTFRAWNHVRGFRFRRDGLKKFFQDNPGAFVQLAELTIPWECTAAGMPEFG